MLTLVEGNGYEACVEGCKDTEFSPCSYFPKWLHRLIDKANRWPVFHLAIMLLLIGGIVYLVYLSSNRDFDPDEFDHLHAAFLITKGQTPYRDFFFNHNPLLWYFLAPLVELFGPETETLQSIRSIMLLVPLAIAYLTYLLGSIVTGSRRAALLGATFLLYVPVFLDKSIEIRPDGLMTVFWLLSLYFFITSLRTSKQINAYGRILLAGLCIGLAVLTKQTGVFCLIGLVLSMVVLGVKRKISLTWILFFCAGVLAVALIFLLYLINNQVGIELYYQCCVEFNFYFERFLPIKNLMKSLIGNPFFFVAGISGGFAVLHHSLKSSKGFQTEQIVIWISGVTLLSSLFYVTVPYTQYLLSLLPLLALYSGIPVIIALRSKIQSTALPTFLLISLVLGGIFVPVWNLVYPPGGNSFYTNFVGRRQLQLETVRFVLANTSSEEPVFAGIPIYVFRFSSCRCWSLGFVIPDEEVNLRYVCALTQLTECLQNTRVVIEDKRVKKISEAHPDFKAFLDKEFESPNIYGVRFRKKET